MNIDTIYQNLKSKSEAALVHLKGEYAKLQTGRANSALVEELIVDSFGAKVPLKAMASISIPEPQQIAIQPFNRDQLVNIEKAITDSTLGLNPQNDGALIRLNLPPLTEERRKELTKLVHKFAEDTKISIRNARHEAISEVKKMEKEKLISEDECRAGEKNIQSSVDEYNKKTEELAQAKEKEVLTV